MTITITKQRIRATKKYNTDGIRKGMRAVLEAHADKVKRDLESLTSNWNHDPKIKVEVRIDNESGTARVTSSDDVFGYLNRGTSVRYALMSPDWKSKTRPGSFRSGSGSGRVLYIGKRKPWRKSRKRWPRAGIKGRRWMPDAQKKQTPRFQREASIARFRGKLLI